MSIADNPNHQWYGPVRRLWVILVQLDMLTTAEIYRSPTHDVSWDEELIIHLNSNVREASAAMALGRMIVVVGDHVDYGSWQHHPNVVKAQSLEAAISMIIAHAG